MQVVLSKADVSQSFLGILPPQQTDTLSVNGISSSLQGGRKSHLLEYKLHEDSELVFICHFFPSIQGSAWNIIEEDWLTKGMKISCGDSLKAAVGSSQRSVHQDLRLQVTDTEWAQALFHRSLPLTYTQPETRALSVLSSPRQKYHCLCSPEY